MEFTLDSFNFHFPWFDGDYQSSPKIMNYRGVYHSQWRGPDSPLLTIGICHERVR